LVVVAATAVHGVAVLAAVAVHVGADGTSGKIATQCPPNEAAEMFKLDALTTFAVNDERVQLEVTRPNDGFVLVNPTLGECSVVSSPTGLQLAAEAIDGIAKAQNAIAAAKSKTPFLENFFMSTTPCESRQGRRDEWFGPNKTPAYVSDAPQRAVHTRLPHHLRGSTNTDETDNNPPPSCVRSRLITLGTVAGDGPQRHHQTCKYRTTGC
jgi:hypothetical protein